MSSRRAAPVGRVLADTAVLIADGGRARSDLATLRNQSELFSPVASDRSLWREPAEIGEPQRDRIAHPPPRPASMCDR